MIQPRKKRERGKLDDHVREWARELTSTAFLMHFDTGRKQREVKLSVSSEEHSGNVMSETETSSISF